MMFDKIQVALWEKLMKCMWSYGSMRVYENKLYLVVILI